VQAAGVLGAAILAAASAGCGGQGSPSALAMEPPAAHGAAQDLVLAVSPMGDDAALVVLVDGRRDRMAVYLADSRRGRLRLLAVRDVSADWSLTDYNNDPPLPRDIRARVEKMLEGGASPTGKGALPGSGP
jgi:hypothetical protein